MLNKHKHRSPRGPLFLLRLTVCVPEPVNLLHVASSQMLSRLVCMYAGAEKPERIKLHTIPLALMLFTKLLVFEVFVGHPGLPVL